MEGGSVCFISVLSLEYEGARRVPRELNPKYCVSSIKKRISGRREVVFLPVLAREGVMGQCLSCGEGIVSVVSRSYVYSSCP